jgi:transposase-like protein
MEVLNARKRQAAEAIANGASAAAIARELGIDRATVGRWKKEPDFQAYISSFLEETEEEAQEGLRARVPAALKLIDAFLRGDSNIPANRATAALNIVKAAASIDRASSDTGETAFEERLRTLDARTTGNSR